MHISEGFLPITHCIGWGIAALPPSLISVRAITRQMQEKRENRVLLAASAAFLFTLSSLRMPSITGSSSHPTGTAVGTYLFGPMAMPALALITLLFQALLLAHGGITTLGANLFSLGVIGPGTTWLFLHFTSRFLNRNRSIFVATVAGDLATYVTTAAQLALAYPSSSGGFMASFLKFTGIFLITQIPIAIVEGFLTVALLGSLASTQIGGLESPAAVRSESRTMWWRSVATVIVIAVLVITMFFVNRNTQALGTDDRAQTAVQGLRPGYHPLATPLWRPGPLAEGLLFAAQGAIGVAILWWAFAKLRRTRKHGDKNHHRLHLHPHLNDIAFLNHWRHRNPWEKVIFGAGFLLVVLLVPPMPGSILVALIVSAAAILGARIPVATWLTVLSVPISFAILTALGILVQFNTGGSPITIDWNGVPMATGLLLRSIAAISCLAFIGWTTPLMELIPVFEHVGVPIVLIDLALMIYHFLFVTAMTVKEMRLAQSWRLGRADFNSRLRAVSMLASGLFVRCIERVRRLEHGIEARGYDGHLWVLNPERGISLGFLSLTLVTQAVLLVGGLWLWRLQ